MGTLPVASLSAQLIRFFSARSAAGAPLALITVVSTRGSTYSKPGTQILVDADGRYEGIVSGGCLEPDLVERSLRVIETGEPQSVEYDLVEDDELFGLGIGCEGVMRLLIQKLDAGTGYEPFSGLLTELGSRRSTIVARREPGIAEPVRFRVCRPRRILVLGGGTDAEPLVRLCDVLGWQVTVTDHRPGHIERFAAPAHCEVLCTALEDFANLMQPGCFDAAIVMSHHLRSDRAYLAALAKSDVPFVGLLGPRARRDRLLDELGADGRALEGRLRSPVGHRIGGAGPAAIALEVAAELQQVFSRAI